MAHRGSGSGAVVVTWTLFWQFAALIAWTVLCVRLSVATWPRYTAGEVRDHTDDAGIRWIGDRR